MAQLFDEGKVIIGRGHGGRVALKQAAAQLNKEQKRPTPAETHEEIEELREEFTAEVNLYKPFAKAIEKISLDEGLIRQ